MKILIKIILLLLAVQLSFAQSIPESVKLAFAGVWQYKTKYQTNTVKIHFEQGADYALFTDIGSGMAPAKTLKANIKGKLLLIPAVQNENDEIELQIINEKLYLHATPVLWDANGKRLQSQDAQKVQRIFKRVKRL